MSEEKEMVAEMGDQNGTRPRTDEDEHPPQGEGNANNPPEYIKLKVVGQDANEVHFRIKFGTPMAKLKKSFADKTGVNINSLRFLFDGKRIGKAFHFCR